MKTAKKNQKAGKNPRRQAGEEFPGYPKYDPNADITRRAKRVPGSLDDELSVLSGKGTNPDTDQGAENQSDVPGESEFDVTKEDLQALGPKDLSMDMGDDEQLKQRTSPVDFAGKDLDVPGTELDDAEEETGSEDEENNPYSLGGDSKENLEERKD
jgi:hypothetical protein